MHHEGHQGKYRAGGANVDRKRLNRHKSNKRELALIEKQLDRLYERLENVETVSGKVTKSGDDFPYIEEHVTVQMAEPKAATAIKDQIRAKEDRQRVTAEEYLKDKSRETVKRNRGLLSKISTEADGKEKWSK